MYKLIAIDLDGTLLNSEKKISRENVEIIDSLFDSGLEIIFATGRRYFSAKDFIRDFDRDFFIVANNGNMVRHTKDDKIIHADYFNNAYLEYILELGKKRDMHPILHVETEFEKGDLVGELDRYDSRYFSYLDIEDTYIRVDDLVAYKPKILSMVYLGKYKDLQAFEEEVLKKNKGEYRTYLQGEFYGAEGLLEIVNPDGSKWHSVYGYGKSKGINRDEIICIGDDTNDLDMIKNAGLGIAMKNSREIVKEAADLVTEYDNDNSGVGRVLKDIFRLS